MHKFLIIDTETGGLDPQVHSLLQLGAVVWEDGAIRDRFLVDVAEDPIIATADALAINKIDLRSRPLADEPWTALSKFRTFIDRHYTVGEKIIPCGHNVGLDIGMVKRLERVAGRPDGPITQRFSFRVLDLMSLLFLEGFRHGEPVPTFSVALAWFGIDVNLTERHTALGDAMYVAALLTKFYDQQTELT